MVHTNFSNTQNEKLGKHIAGISRDSCEWQSSTHAASSYIDGLVQDCGNSSAYALELPQSCAELVLQNQELAITLPWNYITLGRTSETCSVLTTQTKVEIRNECKVNIWYNLPPPDVLRVAGSCSSHQLALSMSKFRCQDGPLASRVWRSRDAKRKTVRK